MRVIVARSNSPSKCKKQRPCQKAKCRSRKVRRQSVVARLRAFQGVFAFLHLVLRKRRNEVPRKNAGTVQQTAREELGFTGTYPSAVKSISQYGAQITASPHR